MDAATVGVILLGSTFTGAATTPPPPRSAGAQPLPIAVVATAVGVYAVGPSAVHIAHSNLWQAFESIGLRIAMAFAGFALGYFLGEGHRSTTTGAIGGVLAGAGAAAIDAATLGWDRWYGDHPQSKALLSVQTSF